MALRPYLKAVCKPWHRMLRGGLPDLAGFWGVACASCMYPLGESLRWSISPHWRRPPGVILTETWRICLNSRDIKSRKGRVLRNLCAGDPRKEE